MEVENVSQVTTTAATATPVAVATSPATDVAAPLATNGKNAVGGDIGTDGLQSPTQEKSSNSHPHDSEYDTASDLEGEDYDDDEDDMDDSLTEDEDDETESDDDDEDDEGVEDDMTPQEKVDAEAQKKVDEDRSNPQYIPKKGHFYEHDNRTAEGEGDGVEGEGQDDVEIIGNGAQGNAAGSKSSTTPTISSASKTMKKWQPASAVDRWSHDRFDPSEQAPKSRTELVSAYGYDIRTEDAPPKARRRRRYGRGPSKYNRNWEDESAYLKTNNKERKPPKPSDFPALNENSNKPRRTPRRTREEKENRMERRQREGKSDRQGPARSNYQDDYNDRRERGDGGHKNMKPKSNFNRQGQATVGRQAAMEFKQKNRQNNQSSSGSVNQGTSNNLSNRLEAHRQPNLNNQTPQYQGQQNKSPSSSGNTGASKQQSQVTPQPYQADSYNKKKHFDQGYQATVTSPQQTMPVQQNSNQQQQSTPLNHNVTRPQNTQLQAKAPIPTSNLSQRLQQVQNRNDPSHVGSVQMHALASQNQQQQQQQQQMMQQQQSGNIMMGGPQTPQAMNQAQEQRGPPKRYSSLRRSQHEAQHIAEHQQLQQLHMQQQQAAPQAAMLMPAEQAMLQANLMQMYHQENIQAQMQALQVSQQPNVNKQAGYAPTGPQSQPPGPYAGTPTTPAAYYVAPDAYSAASAAQATQQAASAYAAQQAAPNYLAQQQSAASLAYANPAPTAQQAAATSAFAAAANVGVVVPQTNPAAAAAPNYQNYNTVGGTTYFVPPPTQTSNRPVSLPQRRPTNAIPILPPSEKNKPQKLPETKDDSKSSASNQTGSAPIGSAENIDHIIDNMFVQRPAFQPPATTATTAATTKAITTSEQSSATSSGTPTDNANAANSSCSQDSSNNTQSSEKITNDSSGPSTASEVSNNNLITTQE